MTKIIATSDDTVLGIQNYHAALFLIYDGATASLRPVEWHQSQDHETTFDVYHRRTLEWSSTNVEAVVADADLIRDLAEKLQPLLDRVAAGFTVGWNGSNNVGTLTEDAQAASEEITNIMERLDTEDWSTPQNVWDALLWLDLFHHGVTADTTDEEIKAAAQEFLDIAAADNVRLYYNRGETMAGVLAGIRDEAVAEREEKNAE
jgi:hypothetical protein